MGNAKKTRAKENEAKQTNHTQNHRNLFRTTDDILRECRMLFAKPLIDILDWKIIHHCCCWEKTRVIAILLITLDPCDDDANSVTTTRAQLSLCFVISSLQERGAPLLKR